MASEEAGPSGTDPAPRKSWTTWIRFALGLAGLALLVEIVHQVGFSLILTTLKPAIAWLPLLVVLELCRMACEAVASYLAFGSVAGRIPRVTLFRANMIGQAMANLAPAPRVVNEGIKVALLSPYVGGGAATSVGFVNQAATLMAVGLFSIPCGLAILALGGSSLWVWACAIHAVILIASGLALRAVTKADGPGAWLVRRFPRLASRASAFRDHAKEVGLFARGPTAALTVNRCFQVMQYWIAARAVGIDAGMLQAFAAQGVNLVASAVGVMVPAGLGTTDGAFTLAAGMLGTTAARATALALLIRLMQVAWLFIGSVLLFAEPRLKKSRLALSAVVAPDAPNIVDDPPKGTGEEPCAEQDSVS
jgi:Lysylphosphatidylglycerol synthase TM region